jgi:hypothetical protein
LKFIQVGGLTACDDRPIRRGGGRAGPSGAPGLEGDDGEENHDEPGNEYPLEQRSSIVEFDVVYIQVCLLLSGRRGRGYNLLANLDE